MTGENRLLAVEGCGLRIPSTQVSGDVKTIRKDGSQRRLTFNVSFQAFFFFLLAKAAC